jgi:hypothetical protein
MNPAPEAQYCSVECALEEGKRQRERQRQDEQDEQDYDRPSKHSKR